MDYKTFTKTVAQRAGMPEDTAERVERATLRTLADRISGGEAQDLASQLPGDLQDSLRPLAEHAEAFDVEEFVRRVAERADVGSDEARAGVAAVLNTIRDAVTPGEFEDVLSQLPQEYRQLVGATS
jgi:uncharacterized protein (DUF2267 family)